MHVKNYGPEMLTPLTDTNISASGPIPDNYSQFVSPLAYDEEVKNKIHVKSTIGALLWDRSRCAVT